MQTQGRIAGHRGMVDRRQRFKRMKYHKKLMKRALVFFLFIILIPYPMEAVDKEQLIVYVQTVFRDEDGQRLAAPSHVFADPATDEMYVTVRSRVILYGSDFFPLLTLGKGRGMDSASGLAADEKGNLFAIQGPVEKGGPYRVSVFDASLILVRDINLPETVGGEEFIPSRIALDRKGRIYVAGSFFPGVLILDREGNILEVMAPEEEGRKVRVNDVAVGEDGRIYLLSAETAHVYVFDSDRKLLFWFGQKGGSSGKLSRPVGVAVDDRFDRIYVVDYMRHAVNVYTSDGRYLTEFGGLGWSEGWFQFPSDIDVDSQGRIMVADTFNNRVQVFGPAGFTGR